MSLLAIETSSEQLGVAVVDQTRVLASYELLAERPHATELPQAVQRVLGTAGLALDGLEGIAIDIGPGSFTGLRIGLAFVKALVFRTGTPLIGVPSLDVLAANVSLAAQRICPLVDARQRKIYTARYQALNGDLKKLSDYHLWTLDEFLATLADQEPVVLLGDGIATYRERLVQHLQDRAIFAPPECWWPKAATLGRLALERLRHGQRDDPSTLVPMYLHPMDCTIRRPVDQAPLPSAQPTSPS
ncbi:MAG: tRNA (adenosine(37)-N6)-threonylcarbamoyltransferase complex dimerization subunit type 1 TsaB [Candidatus Omnitrophica bacterium]|nr:tRNA (adenosine(37)-N6)-threonylcarbamoyltransferase complex dimerization subunit type 1 TsaB [Candidatus Omnitrophota bacterium]